MADKSKPPFPKQPISSPGLEKKMNSEPYYKAENYRAANKLENKPVVIQA